MSRRIFLAIFLLISSFFILNSKFLTGVHADDACNDPNHFNDPNDPVLLKCLADFNKSLQMSISATKPLEGELNSLKIQLTNIQANLQSLSNKITQKEKELELRKEKLAELLAVFNDRVARDYKNGYATDSFSLIFGDNSKFSDKLYRLITINDNRKVIDQISQEAADLITQTTQLQKDKTRLAAFQAQVDQNAQFLGGEVKKAKAYQSDLTSQIAQLSARQQEILASRLAGLGIPLYASAGGSCSSDLTNGKDPGFGGGFGMFTYGVPNRVGLSQYGAFGRARAGQNASTILSAYYNFDSISNTDQGRQIHVQGNGIDWTGSLEDYVKRIYEVPDSWGGQGGMEALKAQAIAARSYVLAYTNNGQGSICPTDQCQVFQTGEKGGNWGSAVSQTAGQVMVQGGNPIKAWFSSTHGGYTHSSSDIGWGSTSWTKNAQDSSSSIASFADLKSNAYDKDSPWFYCDWGARSSAGGTAWLKSDEIADIVNVAMLAQSDGGTKEHLYQSDKPNLAGTDTWDADRVKQELRNRGATPFNSISDISVSVDWGSGRTTSVSVNGDSGSQSLSADLFKTYFNLRAPANIQIVGPLFNAEKH